MRIEIEAKLRHGDLSQAMQKRGWNQRQTAEFLGISKSHYGRLVSMRVFPDRSNLELEKRLFELTGKTSEELFPKEFRTREFLESRRTFRQIRDCSPAMLTSSGIRCLPAITDRQEELAVEIMTTATKKLSDRELYVFRRRFIDGEAREMVATQMSVSERRVRQIEGIAIEKVRHSIFNRFSSNLPHF